MKKVKVLIVDDSVVFRSQIRQALEEIDWIEVVGVASQGRIALDKLKMSQTDLLILDLEMPEMNGIETLKELKKQTAPPKVIVFSSVSVSGAETTLEALSLGATDFVTKPKSFETDLNSSTQEKKSPKKILQDLLIPKIENFFMHNQPTFEHPRKEKKFEWKNFIAKAVVIGCSTGGPTVLESLFTNFKGPLPFPIFIVQHMPPIFTASLAERLQKISGIRTKEAQNNEVIEINTIYVAPGNFHMQIVEVNGQRKIVLNQNEQENSVRPAVDPLFRTAAQIYKSNCMGIILTGMGKDGLAGTKALRRAGNPVLIQSKETCVVFGMPGALYDESEYDEMSSPEGIKKILQSLLVG